MEKKRTLLTFKTYFDDYYLAQTDQVKGKIDWTLDLIRTSERIPVRYLKHIADSEGIYEIRVQSGNNIFRIFCFFDKGNIIVLGNGFQKKTQKTHKMKSTAQPKSKKPMKTKFLTTLDEHIEKNYGKRGTKKREEYEKAFQKFYKQAMLELEKEDQIKATKRRLSGSSHQSPTPRP